MKSSFLTIMTAAIALATGLAAHAQSGGVFAVTRSSFSSGGTSAGGVFAVTGTIGQPDAGRLSGGAFTLRGGYGGVVGAVQTPGAPRLSIALDQRTVTVSWTARPRAFVLEQAPDPAAMPSLWTSVTLPYVTNATTINVVEPVPLSNRFYRLRAE